MPDKIYNTAVSLLGQQLTLDPSVPFEVRCAEAVSTVLTKCGIQGIPQRGFASTDDLAAWLKTNRQFTQTVNAEYGGIVISPTQGTNIGHTGIILKKGVASNDSSTGKFMENYSIDGWTHSFTAIKGLQTLYFCACA